MITVRTDSAVPLAEQLVSGLRLAIASGEVGVGDPLPTVRQLAADLGVNLNTVSRAYQELERQGLVRTSRGRGTCVIAALESPRPDGATARAAGLSAALTDLRLAGLTRAAAEALLAAALQTLWPAADGAPGNSHPETEA